MQTLTQLADAARAVIAADRAGELTDELISALEQALNGAELSPATEQSGEAVAHVKRLVNCSIIDSTGCNTCWEDLPDGAPLYSRPQPAPAVLDVPAAMDAADEYARAAAGAHVESLYGTSKGYTTECHRHENEARSKLHDILTAAPQQQEGGE
ncbi:hypothetical protein ACPRNU_24035 [Chromobacterium vaccinii]|uniref:hypothetical protein n=1 Tax=Chromobacterium vaccinii TaxID=1108595 RepID=UPI003C78F946